MFDDALDTIRGFGDSDDEREARHLFAQKLFNRLMFVYFLSRKGWLTFKGDKDYLNALWGDYKNNPNPPSGEHDPNFYYDRLRPLFFGGLNNPQSRDATSYAASRTIFGDVPFLNGGLFEKSDWDERYSVIVPDAVIKSIRDDLFNRFNFTVMESTPLDIEVAVDPEMLGKVFEELVTGRHDSGSYYTPRPVVSFMCREALKRYLEGAVADLDAEAIAQFVDERDPIGISLTAAPEVAKALDDVTVIDPACGSGAYLLGMMQELVELQTKLYNVGVDARSLYELKLHVIQRSLYGVDIDDFAVNIAMLRLWLSLAIEFEGDKPEPLPNLDFKIVTGDSLLGPDPSPSNYGDLFRNRVRQVADKLADLKAQHMGSTEDKAELRDEIERVQRDLTGTLEDFPASKEALDWRIEFAEVFRDGGFDLAIANPPYIDSETMTRRNPDERKQLSGMYSSAKGNWDYYICFWERSMSLLNSSGMAILITPNKWLGICYGRALRSMLKHHINTIADLSTFQVFENAQVSPVVVGAMKNHLDSGFHIMRFDDTYSVSMELSRSRIELLSTDQWGAMLSVYADNILDWTERHPSLIDFCSVRDPFATREAYELKDILVDNSRLVEPHFRLVNTGTIDPFQHYGQKRQRPISSKSTYFLSLMSNCSGNSSLDVTNR